MDDKHLDRKLTWVIYLLAGNLLTMLATAGALVFGLLPKLERVTQSTERVEARFQGFADDVEPVLTAGAGKAVETIKQIDTERLSESATEKADSLIDAATQRAKRFLDKDKQAE